MNRLLTALFNKRYQQDPTHAIRSPGRVNIIGEHTDYNDGFVLPMALEKETTLLISPRTDRTIELFSANIKQFISLDFDDLIRNPKKGRWGRYAAAVVWAIETTQPQKLTGFNGVIQSSIPMGAGVSSSASFELGIAKAISLVNGLSWDPIVMAKLCQYAENNFVGVNCGIMDQLICATALKDHASLIDCRSLDSQHVPLPNNTVIVVMDTGTRRGLVASAYNERRQQCETAAKVLNVKALRDATIEQLYALKGKFDLLTYKRAHHVISENHRTQQAALAMKNQDAKQLGQLMIDSHHSLNQDFEVTNDALNTMVNIALQTPGCFGARMTGAGFGGCAVALVDAAEQDLFIREVSTQYHAITSLKPSLYSSRAMAGCGEIASSSS
jgi:galactokinase